MAATPEKKVKEAVRRILLKHGVWHVFVPANGYGRSGVPDLLCCVQGLFLAIECKARGNKPTKLQIHEIEDIRRVGGVAVIVDDTNVENFEQLLVTIIRKAESWHDLKNTI